MFVLRSLLGFFENYTLRKLTELFERVAIQLVRVEVEVATMKHVTNRVARLPEKILTEEWRRSMNEFLDQTVRKHGLVAVTNTSSRSTERVVWTERRARSGQLAFGHAATALEPRALLTTWQPGPTANIPAKRLVTDCRQRWLAQRMTDPRTAWYRHFTSS